MATAIPFEPAFYVDLAKRAIVDSGGNVLRAPAVKIRRGDKTFSVTVLDGGAAADIEGVSWKMVIKSKDDPDGAALLADSSAQLIADNVITFTMPTGTSESNDYLGDLVERDAQLEIVEDPETAGPLVSATISLQNDWYRGDEGLPRATLLHNDDADRVPTATDDSSEGYAVGSEWLWAAEARLWRCLDATEDAAVWVELTTVVVPIHIEVPTNGTYYLLPYADTRYTVIDAELILTAGTADADVQIDGTSVTGMDAISLSDTKATATASAANTMESGEILTMDLTNVSTAQDLRGRILMRVG